MVPYKVLCAATASIHLLRHTGVPRMSLHVWSSAHYVIPLPEGHRFPVAKYALLRDALVAGSVVAAEAVHEFLASGDARALAGARKRFMKAHGRVFWVLGLMQRFWYGSDKRRERFVSICRDRDVQQLTFESYMNKELVRKKPMAHVRIFFKDVAHLLGLARV